MCLALILTMNTEQLLQKHVQDEISSKPFHQTQLNLFGSIWSLVFITISSVLGVKKQNRKQQPDSESETERSTRHTGLAYSRREGVTGLLYADYTALNILFRSICTV